MAQCMSAHAVQIPTEQSRGDGQCFLTSSPLCFGRVNLALDNGTFAIAPIDIFIQLKTVLSKGD